MANADVEKSSYSGFERFLFFVTPILFTAVLLGVLLLMFNTEWRNAALEMGNKVPVIKSMLPDPDLPQETSTNTDEEITVNNAKTKVEELNALLVDRETALKQATEQTVEQKKQIDSLQVQVDQLTKDSAEKTITNDEYHARISSLADMYGKMTPSKAAPILENLTLDESALVLGEMADTERGRILERMTPKKAADVTMKLKDSDSVDNREIAALQSRIKELELKAGEQSTTLDTAELNRTFSTMKPTNAAVLLLQLAGTNQSKVLRILGVLDDAPRSDILSAMSDLDKKATANLISKLMPTNP
ncbi:magnesium transporter MgtE N-terminal domain-containing protein [Cohnella lupini]|uniref:Flagellar motility protein MotE (MotC chaperone) n=1 Tax=Cohnella lupini TaxID=1294267 RepID=A0A3D9IWZ1_9BACL|nr:MgtE protein [Cohnella lupini]RED66029.1 flagellar motility protein MotE (MotC chaperone) [Cohnella lupini]